MSKNSSGLQNPSEVFSLADVSLLVEAYEAQLLEERVIMRRLLDARDAVEYEKARIVSIARADGLITGKNEAERNEQITIIVANTPDCESGYYFLKQWEFDQERALEIVEAQRKSIEAEISLTKAWLYSQSGVQR